MWPKRRLKTGRKWLKVEINLTNENFEKEVLNSDVPVLVDFWAIWCIPCHIVAPAVSHMAKHFDGKLKVCKVNVDEAPEIAQKYMIQSIPTLIVFKEGKEMERMVGVMPKKNLEDSVRLHIAC
jgi:thioredoxin 1